MTKTATFDNINSIVECNKRAGRHFFSPGALAFFDSRVYEEVFHGVIFITSEQNNRGLSNNEHNERFWTLRVIDGSTGVVSTLGRFQQFDSLDRAREAAQDVEICVECGVLVLPGDGVEVNVEPVLDSTDDRYLASRYLVSRDVVCGECAVAK